MARFLLSTQAFVDFARSHTSPPRKWLATARKERSIGDLDLVVSVMSLASLDRFWREQEKDRIPRVALQARCATLAQEFRDRRGVMPIGDDDLSNWSNVYRAQPDYGHEESFVVASAITRRLTLLDKDRPQHNEFKKLGLVLEVPY